jgi:hypothetical protein
VFVTKTRQVTSGSQQPARRRAGDAVPAIEAALKANWSQEAIDGVKISADGLMSDIHGTSDYRAN